MKKALVATAVILISVILASTLFAAEWPSEITDRIAALRADADAKKDMPASLSGIKSISAEDAKKLLDGKKVVFLDNRVKPQYETEKIPGAVWFLADDFLKNPAMGDKLDKAKEYVLYCNGIHCWRSPATALMLQNLGFTKIHWFREGIPDWKKKGFPLD